MTCNFAKTTATTRFNITCLGGCTNIISVGFLTVGVKHSLYKQNTMLSSWLDDNIYGLHSHCKCCIYLILVHDSGNLYGEGALPSNLHQLPSTLIVLRHYLNITSFLNIYGLIRMERVSISIHFSLNEFWPQFLKYELQNLMAITIFKYSFSISGQARFDCHGRDNLDVTKMVVDFCGGKEVCDFKPGIKQQPYYPVLIYINFNDYYDYQTRSCCILLLDIASSNGSKPERGTDNDVIYQPIPLIMIKNFTLIRKSPLMVEL